MGKPWKKNFKKSNKSNKKSWKKRPYKRRSYKSKPSQLLFNHKMVMPDRYCCEMELEMTAKIPSASPSSGFFHVQANSAYSPFGLYAPGSTNYSMNSGVVVGGGTTNFTITNGNSTVNSLKSIADITKFYSRYKVNWSKLTLMPNITGQTDAMQITIVPFAYADRGNFVAVKPTSYLSSVPYSKEKVIVAGSAVKDQIITCSTSSRKIQGLNKYQYGAKRGSITTGAPADNQPSTDDAIFYFVQYNVLNDSTISANADCLTFKLKCLVEFTDRIQSAIY